MAPQKWHLSAVKFKPDFTNGMLSCALSAKRVYHYPCIIQRLS